MSPGPGQAGFVQVEGGAFVASTAGQRSVPFVPRGVGSYPLLDHVGRGRDGLAADIFAQAVAMGRPLVRTHAFFDGGRSPARLRNDDGTPHEPGLRALDRVLCMAKERGVWLLLPVANNWHDYGGAPAVVRMVHGPHAGPLGKDAFFTDPACVAAQRDHIIALLTRVNHLTGVRYAEDPTVFAWELCNEPRLEHTPLRRARRGLTLQPFVGRGPGRILAAWAVAMRQAFDAAGARQLVGWGGSGHRGSHGEDMEAVLATGAVDFATLHLYPFATHPSLLRVRPWSARAAQAVALAAAVLRDRAALARAYGVPLLLEEFGWKTGAHTLPAERQQVMRGMLQAARDEGVGTLPWMIAERGRQDYDGLLIRPEHRELVRLLATT